MAVPTVPNTPAAVAIDGAIVISWTAPTTPGGAITAYTVDASTDGGTTWPYTSSSAEMLASNSVTFLGPTPGTAYTFRVRATNASGAGPNTANVSATALARTLIGSVRLASVQVPGGVTVELRSDGATAPVITLGYSKLTDGVGFTAITTLGASPDPTPFGFSAGGPPPKYAVPGGDQDLALIASPSGDIFVIGRLAGALNTVMAQAFTRTGSTNVWTPQASLTQAISGLNAGGALHKFAASYDAGTGISPAPVPSLLTIIRAAGPAQAKHLAYAMLNVNNLRAGSGALFLASGMNPSWLPTPPASVTSPAPSRGVLDVSAVSTSSPIWHFVAADGVAMVQVTNGVPAAFGTKSPSGTVLTGPRARILGLTSTTYALINPDAAGNLVVSFYAQAGPLGSYSIPAATFTGGAAGDNWDVLYNPQSGLVSVYVLVGARAVSRIDVSPVTYLANVAVVITTTLGAAASVNSKLKVAHAVVIDERRVILSAANVLTGTQSLAVLDERSGNVAPNAPALTPRSNFDAATAATFGWTFSDPDVLDGQTAYQLVIEVVSTGLPAFDSGKVASAAQSHNLTAATLVNGTPYRWKVRTYDALDQVGSYSSYGTFTPSALGTLTITDPAADGAALNTSSYLVAWTYVQGNGFTQAQRRVRLTRTDTMALVLDTTMQANTTLNYLLTGLISGVPYSFALDIINSNAQAPAQAVRTFTSTFNAPMVPLVAINTGINYLEVVVTNPAPAGSLPEATSNIIQRRLSGSGDAWTTVAVVGYGASYQDRQVASGRAYDYLVTAVAATGSTPSALTPATAPILTGVWLHLIDNPTGTEQAYLYQSAVRAESIESQSAMLAFVGRAFPVAEFGEVEVEKYKLGVKVPAGDDNPAGVEALREFTRARATLCYRDNRGRVVFGVIDAATTIADDADAGTTVGLSYQRVDYTEGS
jgi:hypothetical protein